MLIQKVTSLVSDPGTVEAQFSDGTLGFMSKDHPLVEEWLGKGGSIDPPASPQADPLSLPLARLTFWLAAAEIGVYKPLVRANIDAMPEGPDKYEAIVWFEEATVYRRYDPLLIQLASAEGISEPQLDALWLWALGAA